MKWPHDPGSYVQNHDSFSKQFYFMLFWNAEVISVILLRTWLEGKWCHWFQPLGLLSSGITLATQHFPLLPSKPLETGLANTLFSWVFRRAMQAWASELWPEAVYSLVIKPDLCPLTLQAKPSSQDPICSPRPSGLIRILKTEDNREWF